MSIRLALAGFVVGVCAAANVFASPVPPSPLIGNTFDGTLYDVNAATGAATNPRTTSTFSLVGITYGANGTLYGLTTYGGTPANALVSINPATGATTTIGQTGFSEVVEGDLAFSPSGVLYGLTNISSGVNLFTINPTTGAATNVGPIANSTDPSAMIFDASGTLYVLDTGGTTEQLVTLDPTTAAVLTTTPLSVHLGNIAGMAIDPATGTFYVADGNTGGTDNLYTLAPGTGTLTLIGPTGVSDGLAGLAFAVPEPTTFSLLALAGLVIQCRRKR